MEHVTGQRVRARDNRDAGIVKRLEQTQHRRETLRDRRPALSAGTSSAPLSIARRTCGGKRGTISSRPGVIAVGSPQKSAFEGAHRRIEHGVMLFQKIDELAHLGFVRREFARALGDLDEAIAIARFLHFRKEEIQLDEIKMLDLIRAAFDELARRHERRHVPAHPHPARVRMIGDDRNQLRFDGGINLDLDIAVVGIPIDVLDRLLGGVDPHLGRTGEFSGAIDDSGFQNARAKLAAVVEARDALQESYRCRSPCRARW